MPNFVDIKCVKVNSDKGGRLSTYLPIKNENRQHKDVNVGYIQGGNIK